MQPSCIHSTKYLSFEQSNSKSVYLFQMQISGLKSEQHLSKVFVPLFYHDSMCLGDVYKKQHVM